MAHKPRRRPHDAAVRHAIQAAKDGKGPGSCPYRSKGWTTVWLQALSEYQQLALAPPAGEADRLRAALRLAKDMMLANGLDLPHTMAVINDALQHQQGPT